MKKRNIAFVLLMSFLTLGIYIIYWLYATRKELLNYLPDKNTIPRVFYLFLPWLVLISLFLLMSVVMAFAGTNDSAANIMSIFVTIFGLVGFIGGIVVAFWWFYRYFKGVEMVTNGTDATLMYVLWILLSLMIGPVWTLLVQNDINKFIDNGYRPLAKEPPQQWQQPMQPGPQAPYQPMPPQQPYYPPAPAAPAPVYYGPPAPSMPAPSAGQHEPGMQHGHHQAPHHAQPHHAEHHQPHEHNHPHADGEGHHPQHPPHQA